MGALEWNKVVHGHQGWRLITCMWLHAGVIHLLANMLSLIFIGIRLEQQFGFGTCAFLLCSNFWTFSDGDTHLNFIYIIKEYLGNRGNLTRRF